MLAAAGSLVAAPRGELYLKLSTGLGLTHDSDLDLRRRSDGTALTFADVTWEDHSLEGPSSRYTAVRFGYFFARRPWFGVAIDFVHYKVFAIPMSHVSQKMKGLMQEIDRGMYKNVPARFSIRRN